MIELHTFGEAMIRVDGKEVRPSAPVLFAALLYLAVERGRRVPRPALQELLFPEKDERSGAHSLRQLLYKLRQLGVPLELSSTSVVLASEHVTECDDVPSSLGVLAGFTPQVSESYAQWLDRYRASCSARVRSRLITDLSAARRSGDSTTAARLADLLLSIDPLNEEATFARAESLAVQGQKALAVQQLEQYAAEVGAYSPELRLSADILRKRIADRFVDREPGAIPLVGRDIELAELLSQFERAAAGRSTMSVVWGDAGIGKSRLLQELRAHLALRPAVCASTNCRSHDIERPLGAVLDLIPTLLRMPGALAVDPESLALLRRTTMQKVSEPETQPASILAARIRVATEELLSAIAAEHPLVLIVEDTHWLDSASQTLLEESLAHTTGIHIVMSRRTSPVVPTSSSVAEHVFPRRLTALPNNESERLLQLMLGDQPKVEETLARQCVQLSRGSPLFLQVVATHLRHNRAAPSPTTTLADLLRQRLALLSAKATLLVRALAILGANGSYSRLKRSLGYAPGDVLLAVQEAANAGLVTQSHSQTSIAHDLVADTVLADTPGTVSVALNDAVAQVLEEDGRAQNEPALLFACAECWVRAANPARAADVLKECAAFALQVGEPSFAIQAFERAQELCKTEDQEALITATIRCADDAGDSAAVRRNVDRIRGLFLSLGQPANNSSVAELAAVNERRRAFHPAWESRDVLTRCMNDRNGTSDDRLKAARLLIVASEEHMERQFAEEVFTEAIASIQRTAPAPAWMHFELTYHGTFGDLDIAEELARSIFTARTHQSLANPTQLGHAALVLFRSGALAEAMNEWVALLSLGARLRLHGRFLGEMAGQAASAAIYLDDLDRAAEYQLSCHLFSANVGEPDPPGYYANAIEIAIGERDPMKARHYWQHLQSTYPHFLAPNHSRTTIGHLLILEWLEGKMPSPQLLDRAEALYDRGKSISECDVLAVGLAISSGARGRRLFEDYFRYWRRDRFPLPPFCTRILKDVGMNIPQPSDASVN